MEPQKIELSQFKDFCEIEKITRFVFYNNEDREDGVSYKLTFDNVGYSLAPWVIWFTNNGGSLSINDVTALECTKEYGVWKITICRENHNDVLCSGFSV